MRKRNIAMLCFAAALVTGCSQSVKSTLTPLDAGQDINKLAARNGFLNEGTNTITKVIFYAPDIVRVVKEPAKDARPAFQSPTVIMAPEQVSVKTTRNDSRIVCETEKLKVNFDKATGALTFLTPTDKLLMTEDAKESMTIEPVHYASGDTQKVTAKFKVETDEQVYGFGQPQNNKFSQRNSKFNIHQGYRFVSVPMFQSIKGYGVFLDNPSSGSFEDKNNTLSFTFDDAENLDYYFMYGKNSDGTVALMRKLTGDAPMHPLWTLGFFQSRERYKTQDELLEVAKKYRELHIPFDCMIQDWQYWGEDNDYWNAMQFLNPGFSKPQEMFDKVHEMNAHLTLVIWPDFGQKTEQYKVFEEKKMLLPITSWPDDGKAHPYDPYNAEARDIYWSYVTKLLDYGVDAWWMDSTEPDHHDIKETDFDLPTGLGTFRRVRNLYPFMTTGGIYEHQRADNPNGKRVFILTRCAYAGQQRFGTNTWSGDTETSWKSFRDQIACGLNMSLVGLPYWNADIGGFFLWAYPRRTRELSFHELYARWMQFGAFTPMMRSHGTDGARELYYYGEAGQPVYDAMVRAIKTRYAFIPYIYSMMYDTYANRGSMMRPLFADFAADKKTHTIETEYLFGKSLLVAPVFESQYLVNREINVTKIKSWDVYLPAGADFYDFHTGVRHTGGQTISKETPLDLIPLYVRAGSILPIAEPVEYAQEKPWDDLEIRVYAGANGKFTLYEDEFDNYNYEKGKFSTIEFLWDDNARELTIGKQSGKYNGMLKNRKFRVVLVREGIGVTEKRTDLSNTKTVEYNGEEMKVKL